MASGNKAGTRKSNWYKVKDQKFLKSVPIKTEKSVEVTKDGKTYYNEEGNFVSGLIKRLFIHEEDNGKGGTFKLLSIEMMDGEQKENVEMYFNSKEAESFYRRLPNIDLTKPVELIIRKTDPRVGKNGKSYTDGRIDVYQLPEGEEKPVLVPFFHTKDVNPLPPFVEKEFEGKKVYDKKNLYDKFEEIVAEANNKLGNNPNAQDFADVTNAPDNGSAAK